MDFGKSKWRYEQYGVAGQRFDASGTKMGTEFLVNTTRPMQKVPLRNGSSMMVVLWSLGSQTCKLASNSNRRLRSAICLSDPLWHRDYNGSHCQHGDRLNYW